MTNDAVQMNHAYANPLCEKLQREFRNRGVNAPGKSDSMSTREIVRRVSAGLDPYEREETTVFRTPAADATVARSARVSAGTVAMPRARALPGQRGDDRLHAASLPQRTAAGTAERQKPLPRTEERSRTEAFPGRQIRTLDYVDKGSRIRSKTFEELRNRGFAMPENTRVPGYARAYRSAECVRNTAAKYYMTRQREAARMSKSGLFALPGVGHALAVTCDAVTLGADKCRGLWRHLSEANSVTEERIASRKRNIPVGAIILAAVFTLLLMVIIYSFSQVYEIKDEMNDLQTKQTTLSAEQSRLSLDLEVRDDIRVIRQIATEKLGMVSADAVQSRYVSVSGGERIELADNSAGTPAENSAADSSFFSGLVGRFNDLRYYFD